MSVRHRLVLLNSNPLNLVWKWALFSCFTYVSSCQNSEIWNFVRRNSIYMMTSSNGNIFRVMALCVGNSPVTGEFISQRPVTRSFDVFFDLCLNNGLSEQSRRRWFEMPFDKMLFIGTMNWVIVQKRYRKISNIRRTKSQNLSVFRPVLQLF